MYTSVSAGSNSVSVPSSGSNSTMRDKRKRGQSLGSLVSAMIPGAEVGNKGRILVNVGTCRETITFNIGGTTFETYRSTLFRLPNSPLANDTFLQKHYRPEKKDYFFDRDPEIFRATLNYLRTGELHIPSFICGPAAKTELEFWGVVPSTIERCCWTNYNSWNCTLEALNQLDYARNSDQMITDDETNSEQTWWRIFQPRLWNVLNNPESSVGAKIYGITELILIFVSIFTFVAGTTQYFATFETIDQVMESADSDVTNITSTPVATNVTSSSNSSVSVRRRHEVLATLDSVCLVFFTVEYVLRLIFAPKKLKFVTSVLGMIDLLAILPEYIEYLVYATRPDILLQAGSFDVISCFKILRILRIFRLIKHVPGLWILVYTLKSSFRELVLLTCFMLVGILLFSSLIYFAEDRSSFASIPEAFWWAIITMTTVGYGDMYPETVAGKLIGSICAMSGLLMIGFSVPALVNNFLMYYKHVQYSLMAEREASCKESNTKIIAFNGDGNGTGNETSSKSSYDDGGQEESEALMPMPNGCKAET